MNRLEGVMATLDYLLNSKRKRHIAGGILMSSALLFVGLAFTVIILKSSDEQENEDEYEQGFIE